MWKFASALAILFTACSGHSSEPATAPMPVRVSNTGQAPAPQVGAMTRTTLSETARSVVQVLRLAPDAEIAEHYHPFFDENFVVEQGSVRAILNGTTYELHAGDVVVIPASTVIRGRNTGNQEARVVVVFTNIGKTGPLSVSGAPKH
ncbi:MAG: cupin domain-containing protein [Gemmatimonadaceae bacterium]